MARTRREKVPKTFEALVAYLTRRPHVWRHHYIPAWNGPLTFLAADLLGDLHFEGPNGEIHISAAALMADGAALALEFLSDGFVVRSPEGQVRFQYLAAKEGNYDAS